MRLTLAFVAGAAAGWLLGLSGRPVRINAITSFQRPTKEQEAALAQWAASMAALRVGRFADGLRARGVL